MVIRKTLDGFQGGLHIGGRMITNLRYADDIILLATSEAELHELVDRPDLISRKYSLLINVDKTKVMASDGIACRVLIHNELLEQVSMFPYLGSLITEDGECTTAGDRGVTAENMEKSQHNDFNEDTTNESAGVAYSNV